MKEYKEYKEYKEFKELQEFRSSSLPVSFLMLHSKRSPL